MKIILAAVDSPLADAWENFCGDLDNVTVHRGSILSLQCDAVISPANSFGFMDGGIDALYSKHFGWHVQERLQELIRTIHHGELVVGNAEIVDTDDPKIPYLIAAPTMRVPMILRDTVNPYLAARAVLLLVQHGRFSISPRQGEKISETVQTVAFPGLGTGIGRVGPNTCARQVRVAIEEFLSDSPSFPRTWAEAMEWHQLMYTDRIRNLQRED